jgi:hypothetical protein
LRALIKLIQQFVIFSGMKHISVLLLSYFFIQNISAQSGTWTWMGGDTTYDNYGYAIGLGIADASNKPGATNLPEYWTDTAGNFWMFGGMWTPGLNALPSTNNDLWKYDLNTGFWILVRTGYGGFDYGFLGVPDSFNYPPPRFGAATWQDKNGDLWMFGGEWSAGYSKVFFNDIWRYNIATNIWTWMGEDQIKLMKRECMVQKVFPTQAIFRVEEHFVMFGTRVIQPYGYLEEQLENSISMIYGSIM